MKSNRGASKRFKVTGSGKVRYNHSFKRHKLTSKSSSRKRKLSTAGVVADVDVKRVRRMIQE
jgi:large subunit ribosomal protein L35